MEEEIWKEVKGFEGFYDVSNFGRVRSLSRNVKTGIGTYVLKGRILKPQKYTNGYVFVSLSVYGVKKQFLLHKIVALAFVEGFKNGLEVNHKDLDKKNNKSNNLEWCTKSENHKHLYRKNKKENTIPSFFTTKGEENPRAVLKEQDVLDIRKKCSNSEITRKEASKIYGVSKSAIDSLMIKKTWKHI